MLPTTYIKSTMSKDHYVYLPAFSSSPPSKTPPQSKIFRLLCTEQPRSVLKMHSQLSLFTVGPLPLYFFVVLLVLALSRGIRETLEGIITYR